MLTQRRAIEGAVSALLELEKTQWLSQNAGEKVLMGKSLTNIGAIAMIAGVITIGIDHVPIGVSLLIGGFFLAVVGRMAT